MHTPRIFFLKAIRKVLVDMPEKTWNFEREMVGWRLDDQPDLLTDTGDDEMDNEMRFVDH